MTNSAVRLQVASENWPIAGSFTIARGSKTAAEVVTVTLTRDGHRGRGEGVPYARYGESVAQVLAAFEDTRDAIENGCTRKEVPRLLEPYAARNALDCALWDLEAKLRGKSVWQLAGLDRPKPLVTAYTLSLDTPEAMARAAAAAADRPLLKLKLGREGDADRLRLIRAAAPQVRLIVDANEGWNENNLTAMLHACAAAGVELIEQPLPAGRDDLLSAVPHPVAVCADESAHTANELDRLIGKYDAVNIKLDKTGGLTGALALAHEARAKGMRLMTGCMLATSLAMAPAMLVAQLCEVVDLDGPLLLKRDREPGLRYEGSLMHPPDPALWG